MYILCLVVTKDLKFKVVKKKRIKIIIKSKYRGKRK